MTSNLTLMVGWVGGWLGGGLEIKANQVVVVEVEAGVELGNTNKYWVTGIDYQSSESKYCVAITRIMYQVTIIR